LFIKIIDNNIENNISKKVLIKYILCDNEMQPDDTSIIFNIFIKELVNKIDN